MLPRVCVVENWVVINVSVGKPKVLKCGGLGIVPEFLAWVYTIRDAQGSTALQFSYFVRVTPQIIICKGQVTGDDPLQPLDHHLVWRKFGVPADMGPDWTTDQICQMTAFEPKSVECFGSNESQLLITLNRFVILAPNPTRVLSALGGIRYTCKS